MVYGTPCTPKAVLVATVLCKKIYSGKALTVRVLDMALNIL